MPWDLQTTLQTLNSRAGRRSLSHCAKYVREAILAGGVVVTPTADAKDYGPRLLAAGFLVSNSPFFKPGDVAVIQDVPGHPSGHMTMFNGTEWVSDYHQSGGINGYYPGHDYIVQRPPVVFYRMRFQPTVCRVADWLNP
jgi:hypothetical protein